MSYVDTSDRKLRRNKRWPQALKRKHAKYFVQFVAQGLVFQPTAVVVSGDFDLDTHARDSTICGGRITTVQVSVNRVQV